MLMSFVIWMRRGSWPLGEKEREVLDLLDLFLHCFCVLHCSVLAYLTVQHAKYMLTEGPSSLCVGISAFTFLCFE